MTNNGDGVTKSMTKDSEGMTTNTNNGDVMTTTNNGEGASATTDNGEGTTQHGTDHGRW
jgi:hypothetical protein